MTAPWQRSWLKSKNNPLIFIRDVLGATTEPWQAEALEAVGRHERIWPRVLAISPSAFTLCSHHKIVKLSRGVIPFFPGAVTLPLTLVIQP